jgi:hypothetical protein
MVVRASFAGDTAQGFLYMTQDGMDPQSAWFFEHAGHENSTLTYTVDNGVSTGSFGGGFAQIGPVNNGCFPVGALFTGMSNLPVIVKPCPGELSQTTGMPAFGGRIQEYSTDGAFKLHFHDWVTSNGAYSVTSAHAHPNSTDVHLFSLEGGGKAACAVRTGGVCPSDN